MLLQLKELLPNGTSVDSGNSLEATGFPGAFNSLFLHWIDPSLHGVHSFPRSANICARPALCQAGRSQGKVGPGVRKRSRETSLSFNIFPV